MIDILNEIMNWHRTYQPNYANSFLDGLSRQEINSYASVIDGYISEDVYQLYEWRNGTKEEYWKVSSQIEPFLYYRPFEEVIEDYKGIYESINVDDSYNYEGNALFPFMLYEKYFYTTVISQKKKGQTSVIGIFDPIEVEFIYNTLEEMMNEIHNNLKSGRFYADQHGLLRERELT